MASLAVVDISGEQDVTKVSDNAKSAETSSDGSGHSNPQSSSNLTSKEGFSHSEAGRESETFDNILGSLERTSEVDSLTERISGIGLDFDDTRFSMGDYIIDDDQAGSLPRGSDGMGSVLSLEGEDLRDRPSISAFEAADSFPRGRNSIEALPGAQSSLGNPLDVSGSFSETMPNSIKYSISDSVHKTTDNEDTDGVVQFDDEKGIVDAEKDWVNAAQMPANKIEQIKAGGAAAVLTTPKQMKKEQSKCDIAEVREIWSNCCGTGRGASDTLASTKLIKEKKRLNANIRFKDDMMQGRRTSQKLSARDSPSLMTQRKHLLLND